MSLVLHLGWGVLIRYAPEPTHAKRPASLIELSVEPAPAQPAPAELPPEEPPAVAALQPPAPASNRRRARPEAPVPAPAQPQPAPAEEASAAPTAPAPELAAADSSGPALATPPTERSPEAGAVMGPIDLSPRRAAASMSAQVDSSPRACRPRGSASSAPSSIPLCEPEDDSRARAAGDRLNQSLQASARALAHLAKREPPQLQRQSDGTLHYEGTVFSATVGQDGQVKFEDSGSQAGFSSRGFGASFDLNDAVQGALGDERYSAEKSWFLEQTAQVRRELADRARLEEGARARRMLEEALAKIIAGPLHPTQKRAKIFALWEDCAEDADAQETQRLVEAFVRRNLPRDSSLGYSDDELRALNAGRPATRRFDPYRG